MTTDHCPRCRASLPAPRSRLLGGVVVGLAYAVTLAFGLIYACLGPLGIMFLPLLVPGAIAMISSAHAWADDARTCPACEAVVESASSITTPMVATSRSTLARA